MVSEQCLGNRSLRFRSTKVFPLQKIPTRRNPNPNQKRRGRKEKRTHRESPRARRQRSAAVRPRPFLSISMRIGKPRHGDEEHHLRRGQRAKGAATEPLDSGARTHRQGGQRGAGSSSGPCRRRVLRLVSPGRERRRERWGKGTGGGGEGCRATAVTVAVAGRAPAGAVLSGA
jgi:hypothetical protein